ncbi:MAG: hypothetical protein WBW93_17985 [Steroidobacteraceae bacterium]
MFDRSSEGDDYGSIAFLDGSTSLAPADATIDGRRRRLPSLRRVALTAPSGFTRHDEIEVGHIMTPWDSVPTIDLPWVASATVGDVLERFQRRGDSHFVIVEYAEQGGTFVRGMFSRTQLQRQTGQAL